MWCGCLTAGSEWADIPHCRTKTWPLKSCPHQDLVWLLLSVTGRAFLAQSDVLGRGLRWAHWAQSVMEWMSECHSVCHNNILLTCHRTMFTDAVGCRYSLAVTRRKKFNYFQLPVWPHFATLFAAELNGCGRHSFTETLQSSSLPAALRCCLM